MPEKDFDAARPDEPKEPITFRKRGRSFTCIPRVGIGVFVDVQAIASMADDARLKAVMDFLDAVLTDDSAHLMAEAMRSKTSPIDVDDLLEVLPWILEQYAGRPTPGSAESSAGPSSTGESSTDAASATASTSLVSQ